MKIRGQKIQSANRVHIFIPRGENAEPISLWAQAVQDFELFNQLVPAPKAPTVRRKGKIEVDNDDPTYKQACANWDEAFSSYMIIKSLDLPENELEWETVDFEKPKTWKNYVKELRDSGFTTIEIQRIVNKCLEANCLNERHIEEARQNFLLGTEETNGSTFGQDTAPASTKSGEPASGGESGHQEAPSQKVE